MEEDKTLLSYSIHETDVRQAITGVPIEKMDLTGLPIEVAYANIGDVPNETYALIRRHGLGGSDASVLLGVNPFTTLPELIKEKASPTISEEEKAIGEKVAVRKGRDLEPLIIQKFEKYFKQHIFKPADMYRFKEFPYLIINFDGITGVPKQYIPVEIKVITMYGEKYYNPIKAIFNEIDGFKSLPANVSQKNMSVQNKAAHYGMPPYYYTQLQQEIFAADADFGYLSVLYDKSWRFFTFFAWRDEAVINDIILQGYKTWEKILELRRTSGWDKAGMDLILMEQQQSIMDGKDPNILDNPSNKPSEE